MSPKVPSSAEEALLTTRSLLQAAGVKGATVSLEKNATIPGGLAGAELKVTLPIPALEAALHEAAVTLAAEQGVKVTQTSLAASQAGNNRLHLNISVQARVFGGGIEISVEGDLSPEGGTHLRFSGFKMEGGGGMFGGIATSMIRPKLAALEAAPIELQTLAGVPVELTQLACAEDTLTLKGAFTSPSGPIR